MTERFAHVALPLPLLEPYSYRVQLPVEGTPRYVAVVTIDVR